MCAGLLWLCFAVLVALSWVAVRSCRMSIHPLMKINPTLVVTIHPSMVDIPPSMMAGRSPEIPINPYVVKVHSVKVDIHSSWRLSYADGRSFLLVV